MPWNPELPSFVRELTPYLQQYGYGAILASIFLEDFGLLVPGETFLIAASLFAAAGSLKIQWVIAAGIVGAVLGDNVGYSIGHFGGCKLVLEHEHFLFLSKARWDKLEESFKQWGPSIVIVAWFSFFYRDANNQ